MLILVLVLSYLLGAIPCGLIVGKTIYHKDLRRYGSGNIGATNAYRVLGKKAGVLVFILDFLKGAAAVLLASFFIDTPAAMVLAGLCAIVGHMNSIFLKFKGGKGVSTALGVITILMPKVTLIVFLFWAAVVFSTKYVSVASISAAILTPILAFIFNYDKVDLIFSILAAVFIIFRHRENISRLRKGKENRF